MSDTKKLHVRRGKRATSLLSHRTCTATSKRSYETRRDARAARARHTGSPLSIYRCDDCAGFHLGHLPRAIVAGKRTRP